MPTVQLSDRAVIEIDGPDAEHFLQNIVTTDLDALGQGEAKPGALLTPQGKILFDFLVSRRDDGFLLDCRAGAAEDFVRRLTMYKLRAKVEISKRDQPLVLIRWEVDSGASDAESTSSRTESTSSQNDSAWLADRRFPPAAGVARAYGALETADAAIEDWTRLRIAHGIAESGADFASGDAFPHDVLLDLTGGVGFRKGCYVGQEVVSRMQHRGTARRRVMIARGEAPLPEGGTDVLANGRTIGTLGTVLSVDGLAIMRIDRVRDALDAGHAITAGDVAISLAIPEWAGYALPQDAGAEGA